MLRWSARLMLSLVLVCLCAQTAVAHPLGNFTINHLTRVTASHDRLALDYTLDIAEIPSFQIMHAVYGPWGESQLRRWADDESRVVVAGLTVTVDGRESAMVESEPRATLR